MESDGKVKVKVCVRDKILVDQKGGTPIAKARVWAVSGSTTTTIGITEAAKIGTRETGNDGCVTLELIPGTHDIKAEAFGKSSQPYFVTKDAFKDLSADDVLPVDIGLPVGFSVEPEIFRDESLQPEHWEAGPIFEGTILRWKAGHLLKDENLQHKPVKFSWQATNGRFLEPPDKREQDTVHLDTSGCVGDITVTAILSETNTASITKTFSLTSLPRRTPKTGSDVNVTMRRAGAERTNDLALWAVIRKSTEATSFNNYFRFLNYLLCDDEKALEAFDEYERGNIGFKKAGFNVLKARRFLPFTDADAYRILKVATEAFLIVNCGVALKRDSPFTNEDLDYLSNRIGVEADLDGLWKKYLQHVNGTADRTLPYLALVRDKLKDITVLPAPQNQGADDLKGMECFGIMTDKLTSPCLIELIWSYWHEEGMLVQTMNSISRRFQNIRRPSVQDPLANLEIDPLRPLNNLIWGYIQDEQHRLGVVRRTYEYDHHYGIRLYGKAVPELRPADSRSKFLEAFHNLLHLCTIFFQQDDDTTVIADGFPLLNALKEVHLILSEGAHNQFGDLPATARIEMMMQQWLLARPEFREFLPTRIMVAYPEPWMDRVDAMKKLQGWTDTSVAHFRDLGVFGEQILLTVRYGTWSDTINPAQAANWARFWRPEIQGYIYAYRSATGVDLTLDTVDFTLPSIHLQKRLALQGARG